MKEQYIVLYIYLTFYKLIFRQDCDTAQPTQHLNMTPGTHFVEHIYQASFTLLHCPAFTFIGNSLTRILAMSVCLWPQYLNVLYKFLLVCLFLLSPPFLIGLCVSRHPWSFITVKGDTSSVVEDHAIYQGEALLNSLSTKLILVTFAEVSLLKLTLFLVCVWGGFWNTGTKASSEARSLHTFHSGYGEHFIVTTVSQWVQGESSPLCSLCFITCIPFPCFLIRVSLSFQS